MPVDAPVLDSYAVDRIKHVANTDVIRRLLIKYFHDRGFSESFDRQMYPAIVQDLPLTIPVLSNKIEVVPHAKEIDTSLGRAVLGWNMFILGNHRMYLGETYHNSLRDLSRQIKMGAIKIPDGMGTFATARRQTTPRRVIHYITHVLGEHESGYVDLNPMTSPLRSPGEPFMARQTMLGMPQQMFTRSGYGT